MLFFAVYTMYTFISSMRINLSEIIPLSSTATFDLNFNYNLQFSLVETVYKSVESYIETNHVVLMYNCSGIS